MHAHKMLSKQACRHFALAGSPRLTAATRYNVRSHVIACSPLASIAIAARRDSTMTLTKTQTSSPTTSATPPKLPPMKPPPGITEALPSWELEAECWIFPLYTTTSEVKANKEVKGERSKGEEGRTLCVKQGVPLGSYHPHEDVSELTTEEFQGGPGGWVLYRYRSSPVGPYDELIYIAGIFSSKASSTRGLRITNIYVSTEASVWNGRRNWNIPKHVARFDWTPSSVVSGAQVVQVSRPDASQPFFDATLTQSKYIPYLPLNTRYFPSLPLFQPPVLQGKYKRNSREASVTTASRPLGVHRACAPSFRGRMTVAYCQPTAEGAKSYGDGESFPEAQNTLGVGLYMPNVIVDFPWSKEYAAKG